jgi:hypothetical protein
MLICLPFYAGDTWLAIKSLKWMQELDGKLDYDCILSFDTQTDPSEVNQLASQIFRSVKQCRYKRLPNDGWPIPQNHAFTSTVYFMAKLKQPWLWVETDSVPMRSGWLDDIAREHKAGRKPFTGHWNEITKVFNGVAVYPPNIGQYSTKALMATLTVGKDGRQPPWDVYCSKEVEKHLNKANHLFQHIWNNPATNQAWTFPDMKIVHGIVRKGIALFHRNKDGSLIDRLREDQHGKTAVSNHRAPQRPRYVVPELVPVIPPKLGDFGVWNG